MSALSKMRDRAIEARAKGHRGYVTYAPELSEILAELTILAPLRIEIFPGEGMDRYVVDFAFHLEHEPQGSGKGDES